MNFSPVEESGAAAHNIAGVPPPISGGRAYYPALDGLRAVAFLLVFSQHYVQLPWGWTGVEIFFVLSGFLITGILYDTRDARHRFRDFYVRRSLRILPLFYFILLVVTGFGFLVHSRMSWAWLAWFFYVGNVLPFLHPAAIHSAFGLASAATVISPAHSWLEMSVSHFWSLCIEEQFYLVWPAVLYAIRDRRRLLQTCGLIIVLSPALRLLVQASAPEWMLKADLLYRVAPFRCDAFMYGALLALLGRGPRVEWLAGALRGILLVALGAAAVLLGPHLLHVLVHKDYIYPHWEWTWGLVLVDLASLGLLAEALRADSIVPKVLNNAGLRWIGRISYGAYAYHFLLISLLNEVMAHVPVRHKAYPEAVLALAITLALSWLSFRVLETPFILLKRRWSNLPQGAGKTRI